VQAFIFIRIIGGLPYPVWRADPRVSHTYGLLGGIPDTETTFWQQMALRIFQRR
jgi:hypothetical protein